MLSMDIESTIDGHKFGNAYYSSYYEMRHYTSQFIGLPAYDFECPHGHQTPTYSGMPDGDIAATVFVVVGALTALCVIPALVIRGCLKLCQQNEQQVQQQPIPMQMILPQPATMININNNEQQQQYPQQHQLPQTAPYYMQQMPQVISSSPN